MSNKAKILVVEDESINSILIKRILTKVGHDVKIASNGLDALEQIKSNSFDVILTDWMMPQLDGIELIRRIRMNVAVHPLIVMVTAIVSEEAKEYSLKTGADDFVTKPVNADELLSIIENGLNRKQQKSTIPQIIPNRDIFKPKPEFPAVVIATSTGGPPTLIEIFQSIDPKNNVAYFIVQHGPKWMLETFANRLQKETSLKVVSPTNNTKIEPRTVYVAPGDVHMKINSRNKTIELLNTEKINFVRPAADPLFQSAAETFGEYCTAVVLTGLGNDGTLGAREVSSYGGNVLIEDPFTATVNSMPKSVIKSNIPHKIFELKDMANGINKEALNMLSRLKKK